MSAPTDSASGLTEDTVAGDGCNEVRTGQAIKLQKAPLKVTMHCISGASYETIAS